MMDEEQMTQLLARCAQGEQYALKLLYDASAAYLNSVAYRILRSQEVSNEVLQEGFLQIWQNANHYRPNEAKPLTWMTSIVRYRALDRLTAERRRQKLFVADDEHNSLLNAAVAHDTPEMLAERCGVSRQIGQCMDTLSDNIRKSIELAYYQGFSREEIAGSLNANTNTVKSWLKRGGERLKNCLEGLIEVQV